VEYDPEKAFGTISKVMQRRSLSLTEPIRKLLLQIFEETAHQRSSAS
jgi:hypothetical protein